MSGPIEQARAEVIHQMLSVHTIPNDGHAERTINEIFDATLGPFLSKYQEYWNDDHVAFRKFIISVAGDIADESMDLAYVRRRDANAPKKHPLVLRNDIHDAARAVMVRRHDECQTYLELTKGEICDPYITDTAMSPFAAALAVG